MLRWRCWPTRIFWVGEAVAEVCVCRAEHATRDGVEVNTKGVQRKKIEGKEGNFDRSDRRHLSVLLHRSLSLISHLTSSRASLSY